MATIDDLEAIRYCDTVDGPLNIVVSDPSADFSAFTDIETITGLTNAWLTMRQLVSDCCLGVGPLSITNSSLASMEWFSKLQEVALDGEEIAVNNKAYNVVIQGNDDQILME